MAEDLGVEMIVIHPRTASEKFTSRLDFDLVRRIKESVKIPIIFSGNVNNFVRAQKTYDLTGVDGVMIGRALWGCPWKIREIIENSKGKEFHVSIKQALIYSMKHLSHNVSYYGENRGFNMFKKQLAQYVRGVEGAGELRRILLRLMSICELRKMLTELCEKA